MTFIGIDLHSNCFTCCYLTASNIIKKSFKLSLEEINNFLTTLNKDCYVMIEASTNTFSFVDKITPFVKEVYVANTHKLKLISMVKKKTDKIDAEKLAIYLKMQIVSNELLVEPVYVPEHTIRELRSLFKTYDFFKKEKASIKNRIHSLLKQNLFPSNGLNLLEKKTREAILNLELADSYKYQIELFFKELDKRIETLDKIKMKILHVGSKYMKYIKILTSMNGISVFIAIALIADIATVDRFSNSKKFASYLRSTPGVDSSNETTKNLKTNKAGRKLSIELMLQSINHFRASSSKLDNWFLKLSDNNTKNKGKSRIALSRKVFTILYQMLKTNKYYWYRNEKTHDRKLKEYKKIIEINEKRA